MYDHRFHQHINEILFHQIDVAGADNLFYIRFVANATAIQSLYNQLYAFHPQGKILFDELIKTIIQGYKNRPQDLVQKDALKAKEDYWFLSNNITGMSLYVDRFCGNLKNLGDELNYFEDLGVNFLHMMPLFESPKDESDGGYAVSDFKKIDERFGTMEDLQTLQNKMRRSNMYLMLDIVLNHTSSKHEWASKAKQGDAKYQDYFYFFNDRIIPDEYDRTMPDIFPESAPGNFTYVPECDKWVMTVFHNYQWDLNYTNPRVFIEMLDIIFYYANIGVDILRIDAPAFIWKQLGTTCQNLPQAHTILRLIKQCVQAAAPGMALLGEAIVAPQEIMKYFGTGEYKTRECDFAYNATHMALQWDALATGDVRVMMAAQHEILQKPYGTSWITYTRSHDDIGLGYDDYMIQQAGFDPYKHRNFLKEYYAGRYEGSPAKGSLFSSNPLTGDARISGSLASLCGLEKALETNNEEAIETSIRRITLMQAHSFFIGGIPMLFYGDEVGYTNDYSYLSDPGKSYDNRWMHRRIIDWKKIKKISTDGSVEQHVFKATKKLIGLRKEISVVKDHSNLTWLALSNKHIAGYVRASGEEKLYCFFNFSNTKTHLTYAFKEGNTANEFYDYWSNKTFNIIAGNVQFEMEPYTFYLLKPM